MEVEILLRQLKKQAQIHEKAGELDQRDIFLEYINSINTIKTKLKDGDQINVNITGTLKKYDGDIEEGKEPVEIIQLTG